jgi:short-subunit dehydrogenase
MESVWITGASSGIGRALALRLARTGAAVTASARAQEQLAALAREAERCAGTIASRPLDVTNSAAVAAVVEAIEKVQGPIDLAVLNAGTHVPMSAADFSIDSARRLIEVNYMGVVNGLAALLPRMTARRRGHIAVVASVAGYRGLPTAAAYGPTKAALINLCESLKLDCDRAAIKLQLVCPGFVETPLTARNDFPMPDMIPVEEAVDRLVHGLASDRFEIAFPPRFTTALRIARCLPYSMYFRIVRRMTKA